MKTADKIELIAKKYDHDKLNNIYVKNTYPGIFTKLINNKRSY